MLNEAQRQAVERTGHDVCVEAGPGSGKTRVLIERFRWLVDNGVSPDRILAFTFTEKAAAEIKTRLASLFQDREELRGAVERAWVSTVHGFCARLLRENPIEAGIDPAFLVLDELQSFALLRESADAALEQIYSETPRLMRELLESLDAATAAGQRRPDLANSLLDIYDAIRTAGASAEELLTCRLAVKPDLVLGSLVEDLTELIRRLPSSTTAQIQRLSKLNAWIVYARFVAGRPLETIRCLEGFECDLKGMKAPYSGELKEFRESRIPALLAQYIEIYFAPLRGLLVDAISRLDRIYRQKKRSRSGLDFSDLEEQTIGLLSSSPEICERARQSFEHILMDELQDTNPLQWRLVDLLRTPGCFFAVGDLNQSIFGFRHATPESFKRYRRSLANRSLTIDTLRENYRSATEVLDAVNSVFTNAPGVEPHRLIPGDGSHGSAPVDVIVAQANSPLEAMELEAKWIARRILELNGTFPFGEMAVLLRTLNSLGPLRRALEESRIPFMVTGAKSFFESREVRDLVHWLRVLDNPLDEVSLAGLLRSPLVGVRDETILWLKQQGGLYEAILRLADASAPADDIERLMSFRHRLRRALADRDYVAADRLLIRAMDDTGYESGLPSAARAAISRLLDLIRSSASRRPGSFSSVVEEIERHRQSQSEVELASEEALHAVRIMSIHRSKGLEFPVVFLPFLHRWAGFTRPAICFSRAEGLAVRWKSPVSERAIPEPNHKVICDELRSQEEQEENRLLYVAMTRAEERLILSYSEAQRQAGGWAALIANTLPAGTRISEPPDAGQAPPSRITDLQPTLLPLPLLTDQHDSIVTATSLSEFQSCPRRYYLGRYLGWHATEATPSFSDATEPRPSGSRLSDEHVEASELGRQVHLALAGAAPSGIDPAALDLVRRFQTSELGRRAARATRIEREYEFVTAIEGIVVRGQIDLWFEEAGELILVDYKTDRFDPTRETLRWEGYALQMRIYAIALQRITGRLPGKAILSFLRTGHSVEVDLSEEALTKASAVVPRLALAQQSLDFPLREGPQCARCDFYRSSCPAGRVNPAGRLPSSAAARS